MQFSSMTFAPFSLLMVLLAAAVAFDLGARRIPNKLILIGLSAALVWHLIGPDGRWTFDPVQPGAVGLGGLLLGACALLLFFLPFYVLRVMGAGDVKLMAMVGAFFGARADAWVQLPGGALTVLLAGGVLSLVRMLMLPNRRVAMGNLRQILFSYAARAGGHPGPRFDPQTDSADRMPYAIAIAAGTLCYSLAESAGWLQRLLR